MLRPEALRSSVKFSRFHIAILIEAVIRDADHVPVSLEDPVGLAQACDSAQWSRRGVETLNEPGGGSIGVTPVIDGREIRPSSAIGKRRVGLCIVVW